MKRYEFSGHLSPTPDGMLPMQMSGPVYLAGDVDSAVQGLRTRLIQHAALLAQGHLLPRIDTEHWYKSTPMAERRQIIEAVDAAAERHRDLAMQIRALADALPT